MGEDKRKHLEFIQSVITRMAGNSFLIKGWMVTLVSALFALAAKDANPRYVWVTFVAILVFWLLDGFYLAQERQYRGLYNAVRTAQAATDFSMNASPYGTGKNTWLRSTFSTTLFVLYGPMFGIAVLVLYMLRSTKA